MLHVHIRNYVSNKILFNFGVYEKSENEGLVNRKRVFHVQFQHNEKKTLETSLPWQPPVKTLFSLLFPILDNSRT